jgi:calpain-15
VQGHAYAILGAYELSDGTKLVKTANPWGRDVYRGDWSDNSPLWTEKFKEEVSHEEESDGVFFQTLAQLKSDWDGLWHNRDIQGW